MQKLYNLMSVVLSALQSKLIETALITGMVVYGEAVYDW